MARDVCSPKDRTKGIGHTSSNGKAGRPLEPLERRDRDRRVVLSDGSSYIRREACVPLRTLGQGVDLRV